MYNKHFYINKKLFLYEYVLMFLHNYYKCYENFKNSLIFLKMEKLKKKNLKKMLKKDGVRSPPLLAPRILVPPLALRHIATGF